jgi:hypothetical protein
MNMVFDIASRPFGPSPLSVFPSHASFHPGVLFSECSNVDCKVGRRPRRIHGTRVYNARHVCMDKNVTFETNDFKPVGEDLRIVHANQCTVVSFLYACKQYLKN